MINENNAWTVNAYLHLAEDLMEAVDSGQVHEESLPFIETLINECGLRVKELMSDENE